MFLLHKKRMLESSYADNQRQPQQSNILLILFYLSDYRLYTDSPV